MNFPELVVATLRVGFHRDRCSGSRILVERQGVVAPYDANLVTVCVHDLLRRWQYASAERALELAELDDRDQRVLGALRGLGVGDGDLEPLDVVRDLDVCGLCLFSDVRAGPRTDDVSKREPADGHDDGQ